MLYRVIFASEAVGSTGATTLSIAQILGAAIANNRRDQITGCMMFHHGHILQAVEGRRADLDRLMGRLRADPRHRGLRALCDGPVAERRLDQPMMLRQEPAALLERVGLPCISVVTPEVAEEVLDLRRAA